MDAAQVHLMLNHFPIAGMVFSILILPVAWWLRNEVLARTTFVAVLLRGLVMIPTYLPGVSEQFIELHEAAAEGAIWAVVFLSDYSSRGARRRELRMRLLS